MEQVNGQGSYRAQRPIRIANCSGATSDRGFQMYRQATEGPVDAITGDYLAEMNLAMNSQKYRAGSHPGWEKTAEAGLLQTLPVIAEKRIKVVINGGALNAAGLAKLVAAAAAEQGLDVKVAYIEGDDIYPRIDKYLDPEYCLKHLDSVNTNVKIAQNVASFLKHPSKHETVCANAYLGGRAIVKALENGADVVICGRVADASPVIALAAWWFGWADTDFDLLAAALIAGHFIECSGYLTGANFCDFERYPIEKLIDVGYPIVEISNDGTLILTKHESLNGFVNVDTATSQLLYELQGLDYYNSDVVADISKIEIMQEAPNRVLVRGVSGRPPPPTTKFAIFYIGGYQIELTANATGRNARAKYELMKAQLEFGMKERGIDKLLDVFDFQIYAQPEEDADTQQSGTSYCRMFVQSTDPDALRVFLDIFMWFAMQHYSGMHCTNDLRKLAPPPAEFLAYYPALIPQSELEEVAVFVNGKGEEFSRILVAPVSQTEPIAVRQNYETMEPRELSSFGPTEKIALDSVVLGRSGDKGGNINLGLFVHELDEYEWLQSFMTRERLQSLMGRDWRPEYWIERVEMPKIKAVHFVVYGILGRGVSSTGKLDALGKGFVDWIRARHVDMPSKFVARYEGKKYLA